MMKTILLFSFLLVGLNSANAQTNYEKVVAEYNAASAASLDVFYSKPWKCLLWNGIDAMNASATVGFGVRSFTYPAQGPMIPAKTVTKPIVTGLNDSASILSDRAYVEIYSFGIDTSLNALYLSTESHNFTETLIRMKDKFLFVKVNSGYNYIGYCF